MPARLPVLRAVLRPGVTASGRAQSATWRGPVAAEATAVLLHISQLHIKNHPATIRGGRELNEQSKVLPCVFAGSGVSATPQRLWTGAQWTVAVPGPTGHRLMYGTRRKTTRRRSHRHLPSAPRWEPGAFPYFKASLKTNFRKRVNHVVLRDFEAGCGCNNCCITAAAGTETAHSHSSLDTDRTVAQGGRERGCNCEGHDNNELSLTQVDLRWRA